MTKARIGRTQAVSPRSMVLILASDSAAFPATQGHWLSPAGCSYSEKPATRLYGSQGRQNIEKQRGSDRREIIGIGIVLRVQGRRIEPCADPEEAGGNMLPVVTEILRPAEGLVQIFVRDALCLAGSLQGIL